MDYCRYDSPTYNGIYYRDKSGFVLNSPVEAGIYMVVMTDPTDGDVFTLHLTVKDGLDSYADYMSMYNDALARISLTAAARNEIISDYGLGEGSTIELYKLN